MESRDRCARTASALALVAAAVLWLGAFQGIATSAPTPGVVRIRDAETSNLFAQVTPEGNLLVIGDVTLADIAEVSVSGTVATRPVTATTHRSLGFVVAPGEVITSTFPGLKASLITVTGADDDRGTITFSSANFTPAFSIGGGSDVFPAVVAVPLTQPMFMNKVIVECSNPVANCSLQVDVVGIAAPQGGSRRDL